MSMKRRSTFGDSPPDTMPDNALPVATDLRTPADWARALGTRASHVAAAAILHGWPTHEHHEGVPMRLSAAAFSDAINAGLTVPAVPSPNALSPHRGKGR